MISLAIALSLLGNNLAVLFVQGRVIQELGREGIPPSSQFFASNKPFNTPMAGLFTQWVVNVLYIIAPPPGDAYLLMVNRKWSFYSLGLDHDTTCAVSAYPIAVINMLLSGGLLLRSRKGDARSWKPPFRAYHSAVWFFFLSNVLLVTLPMVPPAGGYRVYESLPYFVRPFFIFISVWLTSPCAASSGGGSDHWPIGGTVLVSMVDLDTAQTWL